MRHFLRTFAAGIYFGFAIAHLGDGEYLAAAADVVLSIGFVGMCLYGARED